MMRLTFVDVPRRNANGNNNASNNIPAARNREPSFYARALDRTTLDMREDWF